MAGQAQHGSPDRARSSRDASPLVLAAERSAGGSGSAPTISTPMPIQAPPPSPTPSPRAVSRLLQMRGMTPDEAANLTAFLYGLPTADLRWSLAQLNQLLFLRQMRQSGRFGRTDGGGDSQP